jgi:hypothetical protein
MWSMQQSQSMFWQQTERFCFLRMNRLVFWNSTFWTKSRYQGLQHVSILNSRLKLVPLNILGVSTVPEEPNMGWNSWKGAGVQESLETRKGNRWILWRPPLLSSGHSSQTQRFRARFLALPHFLRSSGSETGSIHAREYNWGATWKKK